MKTWTRKNNNLISNVETTWKEPIKTIKMKKSTEWIKIYCLTIFVNNYNITLLYVWMYFILTNKEWKSIITWVSKSYEVVTDSYGQTTSISTNSKKKKRTKTQYRSLKNS